MIEFLIRRTDGDWFDLPANGMAEVLRPSSTASRLIEGDAEHCIEVRGGRIECSYEDPGIQVSCYGEALSEAEARQIVDEMAAKLTAATGQRSRVVPL